MAGDTGKTGIILVPAFTLLQPIRLKSRISHTTTAGETHIPIRPMARPAKVDRLFRGQFFRIEDCVGLIFRACWRRVSHFHLSNMLLAGSMTGLTSYASYQPRLIEVISHARTGSMAGEAAINFGAANLPVHSLVYVDIRSRSERTARREIQAASERKYVTRAS